ncbi:hypothetical protein D3C84_937670 [compost metagenome]
MHLLQDRFAQQSRQALGDQAAADRNPVLCVVVDKARRADFGLVDRQAYLCEADRLGDVVEDDLAGGGNDEGDFIKGGGKRHREITAIVHATKTDTFVPAIDPANDDVFRRRWRV